MPDGSHFSDPIYSDPLFQMAKRQFEVIADYLDIAEGNRERSPLPCRSIATMGRLMFSIATGFSITSLSDRPRGEPGFRPI